MNPRDLKSLNSTISEVAKPETQDKSRMIQEGFGNSLTARARQIAEESEKESAATEKAEGPKHDAEEMKKMMAKALKRAKKKARLVKEEEEKDEDLNEARFTKAQQAKMRRDWVSSYNKAAKRKGGETNSERLHRIARENMAAKKAATNTNEEVELAEVAAPGYEDWASNPKVKARFKERYGKRWKQVMYGHSWNMKEAADAEAELDLAEAYQAKRMRIIRKAIAKKDANGFAMKDGQGLKPEVADFMKRSFKKKLARSQRIWDARSGTTGQKVSSVADLHTRAAKKHSAMKAKGLAESEQVDEEWGGGFQSFRDAHREVQAGLRREASANRKKLVADIKAVHSGKMTPAAFTRKHKTKFSELPLAKKMAASRAKAKAKYLAKKAAKASAPKTDSAPSIMEGMQLDEAGYKRLGRIKAAAYKAELASRMDPKTPAEDNKVMNAVVKHIKAKRAAAEREAQVAAGMARRGGASPDAVRGGGSRIGKSGKYTKKAGKLANQRDKALASFRTKGRIAQLLDKREDQSRKKRERQQAQAKFNMDARHGYFGHEIAPEIAKAGMRARYNYEKKYGRLKGK